MSRGKTTRLEVGVLLVGSGYGALKVAEDLAQSGIPVAWVTKNPHFLELPGGIERFDDWPEDLNFQFRPLYLRVTRHPLVTPLTRTRFESLVREDNGFAAVVREDPHYIDYDLCTGCGRCIEVCPLAEVGDHRPLTRSPAYCPSRALELDKRMLSPCRVQCPLNVNAQAYMALTASGRFAEALAVVKEDNPLPGVCGRICHHPCEESCRRSELDQSVAIRDIKRFLADYEAEAGPASLKIPEVPRRKERAAVIGSGPAGLTAAHFLNKTGFAVTVFEAMAEAGGMLRAGINAFRLPRKVLDAEIRAIADAGVEIRTSSPVVSIQDLFDQGFAAVILCTGTHEDLRLGIPGEDLEGIVHCVGFLTGVNLHGSGRVGARTVVIGAGNSAMDAARTALRLGAREVTVLGIEKEDEMPAHPREVREAGEEGVNFVLGAAPISFEGKDRVKAITWRPAHWEFSESAPPKIVFDSEETFSLEADTVIVAIGMKPGLAECGLAGELETGRGGRVCVDDKQRASKLSVFAAGDVVTGPSTVIGSMASGRNAAARAIEHLTGKASPFAVLEAESRGVGGYLAISDDRPRQWRPETAQRQPKARRMDFEEVDFGFTVEQAMAEAGRCLQCGSCCECRACEAVCEEIKAIDHFREPRRFEVRSPGIIVADDSEMPRAGIKGEDGVWRIGDFKASTDLMDVMVAGSAAAGMAMTRTAKSREHAASPAPFPAEVAGEVRLGVFTCTCNQTMAPQGVLERIRGLAAGVPGVVHSELIFSACHPRGADMIAKAVRSRRLSRVILASCVCCPLEFQCISCNDQRTRARIHLFDRLGLDRSRFEMLNLRFQLQNGELDDDELVLRARDLMRGAFIRARYMGPLRQGQTEIGSRILILGGDDVGLSCAANLDLQGFKVRLVHQPGLPSDKKPAGSREPEHAGRSITHVDRAVIEEIRGHMGNFTAAAMEEDKKKRWQADIICLTDEAVMPLAIHEDMMGLKKFYRYNFAFFHTPQLGVYRVLPRTLKRVNSFEAGAALAAQVARAAAEAFLKDHEMSPRVDPDRCRGCGRCAEICPFNAIAMVADPDGVYHAEVVRHNCVGCGGCVGRCPVTAMDIPYFSNQLLDEIVAGTLAGER